MGFNGSYRGWQLGDVEVRVFCKTPNKMGPENKLEMGWKWAPYKWPKING